MKYILSIALILTVVMWWASIYFFGIYGALGCVVLGVLSAFYINMKGLP